MKPSEKIALILLAVIAAILFMAFFGQILTFFVGLLGVIGISGYALHSFLTSIDWRVATPTIAFLGVVGGIVALVNYSILKLDEKKGGKKRKQFDIFLKIYDVEKLLEAGFYDDLDKFVEDLHSLASEVDIRDEERARAYRLLGEIYYDSKYARQNTEDAIKNFKLAAEFEDIDGIEMMGRFYLEGYGSIIKDVDKAFSYFSKLNKVSQTFVSLHALAVIRRDSTSKYYSPALAFELLKKSLDEFEKNGRALKDLGEMYYLGEGCKEDHEKAFNCFSDSLKYSYTFSAANYLSRMYFDGDSTSINYQEAYKFALIASFSQKDESLHLIDASGDKLDSSQKAEATHAAARMAFDECHRIRLLRQAKDLGSIDAEIDLAMFMSFWDSKLISKDKESAFKILSTLSNEGVARATYYLSLFYAFGDVVEKDQAKEIALIRDSAEKNYPDALHSLADRYERGEGLPEDKKMAIALYERANNLSSGIADHNLGSLFFESATKDDINLMTSGFALLKKAADSGDKEAAFDVGYIRFNGDKGFEKNNWEAFFYMKRAYDLGYSRASVFLGIMYDLGLGVSANDAVAIHFYKEFLKSSDCHDKYRRGNAYHNLACKYVNGEGAPKDEKLAFEYFKNAAQEGFFSSMMVLSNWYSSGKDPVVEKDSIKALAWLYAASRLGFDKAFEEMKPIKDVLTSEGIEKASVLADQLISDIREGRQLKSDLPST